MTDDFKTTLTASDHESLETSRKQTGRRVEAFSDTKGMVHLSLEAAVEADLRMITRAADSVDLLCAELVTSSRLRIEFVALLKELQ